jgi:hypothetical protein
MSLFTEYEKQRDLKSKLQIGSHWRWIGPLKRCNEITLTQITPTEVYYYYTDTPGLHSSLFIRSFIREAVPLVPEVELAQ